MKARLFTLLGVTLYAAALLFASPADAAQLVLAAPIAAVTVGNRFSPRAYQGADGRFVTLPPPVELVYHEFRAADGVLEHYIDGALCASVELPNVDDYVRVWPDAADAAEALKARITAPAVEVNPPLEITSDAQPDATA